MGVQATVCHEVFRSILETPLNFASFSSSVPNHFETVRLVSGCRPVGTLHFRELQLPLSSSLPFLCENPQVRGGDPWPQFSPQQSVTSS